MARKPQKYYKNRERFQILSGEKIAPHGEVMHGMLTGQSDGTVWYKGGREVTVAQERSLEILGTKLNVTGINSYSTSASENGTNPAKLIRAEKGDIILEAPQGKIILSASQIQITATGDQVIDKTGNVFINANSSVKINAPSIQVKGSKTAISGSHSVTIIGQNYLDTIAGFHNSTVTGDALNPCGGIITKASTILDTIKSILL